MIVAWLDKHLRQISQSSNLFQMLSSLLDLDWNLHFYIKVDIAVLECTAVLGFCVLNHVASINLLPFSTVFFSAWMLVQHVLVASYILKCDMNIMQYDRLDNTGSAERRGSLKLVGFLNETLHRVCKDVPC